MHTTKDRIKVSLRLKFIIIAVAVLIVNALILSAFYRLVLSHAVEEDLSDSRRQTDVIAQELADKITGRFGLLSDADLTVPELSGLISAEAEEHRAQITLEDFDGSEVFTVNKSEALSVWIRSAAMTKINDEPYLLRVNRMVYMKELAENDEAIALIWAELCVTVLILIITSGIVYLNYLKPIESLERTMRGYKAGARSHRTERSDELGRLQNSFVDLSEMLDDEKNKQSNIIASISHDIKTPLTSVMGYAERMKKGNLSEERTARYTETIYRKAVAIRDLVNEFDDYISSNRRAQYDPIVVRAGDITDQITADYLDELTAKGIGFSVRCSCPEVPLTVDVNQMRRVFGNLISNAVKHIGDGRREIRITCDEEDETKYEFVVIRVSDTGCGVDENMLEKIFEPLYTSDPGRSVAGLGLAICREAIECHGGTIRAENNSDGGLSVIFTLPINQPEEDDLDY